MAPPPVLATLADSLRSLVAATELRNPPEASDAPPLVGTPRPAVVVETEVLTSPERSVVPALAAIRADVLGLRVG